MAGLMDYLAQLVGRPPPPAQAPQDVQPGALANPGPYPTPPEDRTERPPQPTNQPAPPAPPDPTKVPFLPGNAGMPFAPPTNWPAPANPSPANAVGQAIGGFVGNNVFNPSAMGRALDYYGGGPARGVVNFGRGLVGAGPLQTAPPPNEPLPGTAPSGQGGIGSDARIPTKPQPLPAAPPPHFSGLSPALARAIQGFLPRQAMPQEMIQRDFLSQIQAERDASRDATLSEQQRMIHAERADAQMKMFLQLNAYGNMSLLSQLGVNSGGVPQEPPAP